MKREGQHAAGSTCWQQEGCIQLQCWWVSRALQPLPFLLPGNDGWFPTPFTCFLLLINLACFSQFQIFTRLREKEVTTVIHSVIYGCPFSAC